MKQNNHFFRIFQIFLVLISQIILANSDLDDVIQQVVDLGNDLETCKHEMITARNQENNSENHLEENDHEHNGQHTNSKSCKRPIWGRWNKFLHRFSENFQKLGFQIWINSYAGYNSEDQEDDNIGNLDLAKSAVSPADTITSVTKLANQLKTCDSLLEQNNQEIEKQNKLLKDLDAALGIFLNKFSMGGKHGLAKGLNLINQMPKITLKSGLDLGENGPENLIGSRAPYLWPLKREIKSQKKQERLILKQAISSWRPGNGDDWVDKQVKMPVNKPPVNVPPPAIFSDTETKNKVDDKCLDFILSRDSVGLKNCRANTYITVKITQAYEALMEMIDEEHNDLVSQLKMELKLAEQENKRLRNEIYDLKQELARKNIKHAYD